VIRLLPFQLEHITVLKFIILLGVGVHHILHGLMDLKFIVLQMQPNRITLLMPFLDQILLGLQKILAMSILIP
jgi:hypothetical protein